MKHIKKNKKETNYFNNFHLTLRCPEAASHYDASFLIKYSNKQINPDPLVIETNSATSNHVDSFLKLSQ